MVGSQVDWITPQMDTTILDGFVLLSNGKGTHPNVP
jgi:hypothetical protein